MGELYHGSLHSGIKRLEPHKSTHGTYVYATPRKELAIMFSGRCGDNLTYSLYKNDINGPWLIVERIPNAFETMYNNESSIYTLSDSTFEDINTGFSEVVSEVGVDVLKEERVSNVLDAIKELEKDGVVKLYTYPNRPNDIPVDDSDLLSVEANRTKNRGIELNKNKLKRILYLHPNMLELINEELRANGAETFDKSEIVDIFEEFVIRQVLNPSQEQYIKSAFISISSIYPELIPQLESKYSILGEEKDAKIEKILEYISKSFPNVPAEVITQAKDSYLNDQRSFSQIREELRNEINKMVSIETASLDETTQKTGPSRV